MGNDKKTKNTKSVKPANSGKKSDIKNKKTLNEQELPVSKSEMFRWASGGLLLLVAVILLISFVSNLFTGAEDQSWESFSDPAENWMGGLGVWLVKHVMDYTFGLATFFLPILMTAIAFKILGIGRVRLWKWLINCILLMVWFSVAGAWLQSHIFQDIHLRLGGMHGQIALDYLKAHIGPAGTLITIIITAIAYVGYLSGETVHTIQRMLDAARRKAEHGEAEEEEEETENGDTTNTDSPNTDEEGNSPVIDLSDVSPKVEKKSEDIATTITFGHQDEHTTEETAPVDDTPFEVNVGGQPVDEAPHEGGSGEGEGNMKIHIGEGEAEAELDETMTLEPFDPKLDLSMYKYPTIDLLKHYDIDRQSVDMEEQKKNKEQIVQALRNFGVEISSIKATVGPTITLYEITPAPGVRISKIRNLEDDIALSLSALGIRIIAPIPGKGTVGIEVPNAKPQMVSMESIINSRKFQTTEFELPMALGKTITNEIFMVDLAKMPHLLVAGATGQGKSVGLNAIITSLLYKKHPAELKLVMVDPKKVEFSVYNPIVNHFLAQVEGNEETDEPIITDVNKVVQTLKSLCVEMDTRYDLLKKARARNIKEYNEKYKERRLNPNNGHKYMPYIVVIIDEFGDLIMTAGKEIELPIARIAQLARAVGIHMIIATQRPTTNIITGTIKANFPARMAFKVSAMIDSRTILDRPGANQLVGKGDMLFLAGNEPVRVQCAFVDTPEVEAIANYIACQQSYNHPFPLPPVAMEGDEGGGAADVDMNHLDPMLEEVARLVVNTQQGSTSMIQRKFSIGYNRAGRLMDQLEKIGVVGPAQGSKPREVLIMGDVELMQLLDNLH
ncbi:MAG: DNA translocase FtsK 4TM domain-containing protein [Bacteroidaceae bacterium]|nr:DNA translocase FtsK 4TM domain-containing protein [Bacteroidaceae bacterium]